MSKLGTAHTWPREASYDSNTPLIKRRTTSSSMRPPRDSGEDNDINTRASLTEEPRAIESFEEHGLHSVEHAHTSGVDYRTSGIANTTLERSEEDVVSISATDREEPASRISEDIEDIEFVPIRPPAGYRKLTYLPPILATKVTITLATLYFAIMSGMIALHYLVNQRTIYSTRNVNVYLAARYGPAVTAVITTVLFRSTLDELRRMLPYINMADRPRRRAFTRGTHSLGALYWPLLNRPNSPFTWLIVVLGSCNNFLTAYKGLLVHVVQEDGGWVINFRTDTVALILATNYGLIGCFTIYVTCWLWNLETGLREDWNPRTFADIIALFYWFDWQDLDVEALDRKFKKRRQYLEGTWFRLGYWKRGRNEVVYGIRSVDGRRASKPMHDDDLERDALDAGHRQSKRIEGSRLFRFTPLFAIPWHIFHLVALVFILALLVYAAATGIATKGFAVHGLAFSAFNATSDGSVLNVTMTDNDTGTLIWSGNAEANAVLILTRIIPVFFVTGALSYSTVLDAYFRYMQPLYNMSRGPCSADDSILLGYLTMSPFEVTAEAFKRGHWKVFYFSILSAIWNVLLLVPVSTLTLVYTETQDREVIGRFALSFYVGSMLIVCILIVSYGFAWPGIRRRAPRRRTSLLDMWALFRESHLCKLPVFGRCTPEWGPEQLAGAIQLDYDKYLMGVCHGEEGTKRLGFDMCFDGSTGRTTPYVDQVAPRSSGAKGDYGLTATHDGEGEAFELMANQSSSPATRQH
ncbi:hypothetical protein LTR15_011218 [Elasticomyces elasticus]|nr:hypothetical protein LTR15_011218 [Elasticomyces elasticus]